MTTARSCSSWWDSRNNSGTPTEPGGWIREFGLDGPTDKSLLMQVAIYDNQVSTLGAAYMARAYEAFVPSPGGSRRVGRARARGWR